MGHKWDPKDYAKSSSAQYRWAVELMAGLGLRGDERILDIGCGDGKITAKLAASVPGGCVLGIDSSADMVAFAGMEHPVSRHPNLRFRHLDARELDFEEEFDLVVSFACLHWIEDHLTVLRGIGRGLRPSGRVLLQCGGTGNAADILKAAAEVASRAGWKTYFQDFSSPYWFYGPEPYKGWLKEAGLRAKSVRLIPKDMVQEGKDGVTAFVRTTMHPYTSRVPEDRRGEFVEEVAGAYLDGHPPDDGGLVHVRMVRLQVEAVKGRV